MSVENDIIKAIESGPAKPSPSDEVAALWAKIRAYEAAGKISRSFEVAYEDMSEEELKELFGS